MPTPRSTSERNQARLDRAVVELSKSWFGLERWRAWRRKVALERTSDDDLSERLQRRRELWSRLWWGVVVVGLVALLGYRALIALGVVSEPPTTSESRPR